MDRWMDVWKFTPVFYRTMALWGCYPKRLAKFLGRSSNAKNALKSQKKKHYQLTDWQTNWLTDIVGYRVTFKQLKTSSDVECFYRNTLPLEFQWRFFSHVLRDSTAHYVGPSVGWLVGPLLLFWRFWAFWAYCSCPDALLSFSSTAPAHLNATRIAVYPALFDYVLVTLWPCVWLWVHYNMVSVGWSVSTFLLPISKITIYSLRLRWLLCLKWRIDK